MVGPLGGAGVGDPGTPTINAKKRRRRATGRMLTEIQERPPSTRQTSMAGPWRVLTDIRERLPSTQQMSKSAPLGGPVFIHDPQVCCGLHGQHR
jgi:hypothetical protein